jgi:hypothetical protein
MSDISQILSVLDFIQGKKQQRRRTAAKQSLADFITGAGGIEGTVPRATSTPATLPETRTDTNYSIP